LGIEAMEGRRMLSAMPVDTTILALPDMPLAAIPLNLTAFTVVAPGDYAASRLATDGGYISIGGLQAQAMGTNLSMSGVGRGSSILIELNSNTVNFDSAGATTELFVDHGATGAGFDLRPAVIAPIETGTASFPVTSPMVAGDRRAEHHEGGSIRIETILREDLPGGEIEGGERVATLLAERAIDPAGEVRRTESATDMPLDRPNEPAGGTAWSGSLTATAPVAMRLDAAPALGATILASDLSGEWARAMVFEMAGGESAAALNQAAAQPFPLIRSATPVSGPPDGTEPAARSQGLRAAERAARAEALTPIGNVELSLGSIRPEGSLAPARLAKFPGVSTHTPGAAQLAMVPYRVPDAVIDEVFERLAGEADSAPPLQGDESGQTSPLLLAPMFAMVALERLASGYVSRANDKASADLAGPPWRRGR
jgi:hypothetical protein